MSPPRYILLIRSMHILCNIESFGTWVGTYDTEVIDIKNSEDGINLIRKLAESFNLVISPSGLRALKNDTTVLEIVQAESNDAQAA